MFSHELVTNPWMHYTFQFPQVDWYDVGRIAWMGKRFPYPMLRGFFSGWFGAVLDSDWIRRHIYRAQIPDFKLTIAMGTHSRLGEASILRELAGEPEILGQIASKL